MLTSCTHTASEKELALGVGLGLWLGSRDRVGEGWGDSCSHISKCEYLWCKIWCHLQEMPGGLQDLCFGARLHEQRCVPPMQPTKRHMVLFCSTSKEKVD